MRKTTLILFAAYCLFSVNAQEFTFSSDARVSLITCSPGPIVWERFGHTAIRVYDPANHLDIVFNYGVFDFNADNFILKFIKGATDYKLAAYNFRRFLPQYIVRGSWVWEQVLNLTDEERETIIELLLINNLPENRVYRYNFIFDNCATRPRDIIKQAIDGRLYYTLESKPKTFRQWIHYYIAPDSWLGFGIDMIFGSSSDVAAKRLESMFLPEILMNEFQAAMIIPHDENEEARPLVSELRVLVEGIEDEPRRLFFLFTPMGVSILLLFLGIVCLFRRRTFYLAHRIFDTVVFILFGLIGLVIFYLDYFSLHPMVNGNVNILWLNPLLFFIGIMLWIKSCRLITFVLAVIAGLCTIIALISYLFGTVYFNAAYIPLALLVLIRLGNYIRRRLKKGMKIGERKLKVRVSNVHFNWHKIRS